ncbi:MAG: 4-hydroxy-tetrahydrodipicolinate synthase [Bacteroidetes bacterium HGW-Bacteroidetes-16]|nr:MAG: 4-hydroxy-tetrahydrodipicolinate synthase [Bacteroidetes bacterium HGW-Bacteroidetes-16]
MSMNKKLKGTGVAIVTPFFLDGSIDYDSLDNLLGHLLKGKVDFIVALGTTSEAVTLTTEEKSAVMAFVKSRIVGKIPLVMGMGGNNTQAILDQIRNTDFSGIDAILSVAPYYNKPNQRGLYAHFSAIAKASPLPVILYNVPGRTSSNISADTTIKLANDFKNIVAVKEASGDLGQIMQIIRQKPDGFSVLSGDDALTYSMMALGAEGVISVVANALPREFSQMVAACLKGEFKKARTIHYELLPVIDLLFADGNPAGIKAALNSLGICKNYLRLPLVPVKEEIQQALEEILVV